MARRDGLTMSSFRSVSEVQAHRALRRACEKPSTQVTKYSSFHALACCGVLPFILALRSAGILFASGLPRSWDGSAHYAASYIFDANIYPDTFGWTWAWFGGMPLPNFYPPLFYWIVALLHHLRMPLLLAFKLVGAAPLILLPGVLAFVAWRLSRHNLLVAVFTALIAMFRILDSRFETRVPCGLDLESTVIEGLYTQPLGFVMLALWISIYVRPVVTGLNFVFGSILLALAVLGNFFSAVAILPFACAGLALGLRTQMWRRCAMLACAFMLCMFWTLPVLRDYAFFVTRPLQASIHDVVAPGLITWIWYIAALGGLTLIFRHEVTSLKIYASGCVAFFAIIALCFIPTVRWIPSQPSRLISTFNLLLSIPIALLLADAVSWLGRLIRRNTLCYAASIIVLSAVLVGALKTPRLRGGITSTYFGEPTIAGVLSFARQHTDGQYIVENPFMRADQYDSRALAAYLGAQGNRVLTTIFHEASPSSVFFSPVVNALSASVDTFDISSALAEDMDFFNQSPEHHIATAGQFGVRYIACVTPSIKRRFRQQHLAEYPQGRWSVFQVNAPVAPDAEIMEYLPVLVVSPIDFKGRRSDQWSFTRFVEEQLNSGPSKVLLAHAPTQQIDKLELEHFSAAIVDRYACDNEAVAYEKLRRFSQDRPLVLLSSQEPLYKHLKERSAELTRAVFVERHGDSESGWFGSTDDWMSLNTTEVRQEWKSIAGLIETSKIPVRSPLKLISVSEGQGNIDIKLEGQPKEKVPVILRTTFHPSWVSYGSDQLYPVTPFYMLTFADRSFEARFRRDKLDRVAAWGSAFTFCGLALGLGFGLHRHLQETENGRLVDVR